MTWIAYAIYLSVIAFTIFKSRFFQVPGLSRRNLLLLFSVKLMAGYALWYLYTFYYTDRSTSDIWKFYDDSRIMTSAFYESPVDFLRMITGFENEHIEATYYSRMNFWHQKFESDLFNDSHTIIRFNALAGVLSGGNYHTHGLFMSFLAFCGLLSIYKWIYPKVSEYKTLIIVILFLTPSLTFWSSGVLKEGLLFFALGTMIFQLYQWKEDRKKKRIVFAVLSLFLLAITKLYIALFLLPALLCVLVIWWFPSRGKGLAYLILAGTFAATLIAHRYSPTFSPYRIISQKQNDFLNLARGGTWMYSDSLVVYIPVEDRNLLLVTDSLHRRIKTGSDYLAWERYPDFGDTLFIKNNTDTSLFTVITDLPRAGSLLTGEPLQSAPVDFLKKTPSAVMNVIFRPYPWEISPVLMIPSILENVFFVALIILFLVFRKKKTQLDITLFLAIFVTLLILVTGWTTPVLGAIVRYRIAILPFLYILILLHTDFQALQKRFPALGRYLG